MRSLPPLVTAPTQWILKISLANLSLSSKPKITLKWWGNEESDTMIFSQNKYTIEYHIKCSVKQFEDYCTDLGDLEFVLTESSKKLGSITLSDLQVLRNPPMHKVKLPVVLKGKVVGNAMVVMQITGSKLPLAVRNVSQSRLPIPKAANSTMNEQISMNESSIKKEDGEESRVEQVTVEFVQPTEMEGDAFVQRHSLLNKTRSFEPLVGDFMNPASTSDLPSLVSDDEGRDDTPIPRYETGNSPLPNYTTNRSAKVGQSLKILQELEQRALNLKERIAKSIQEPENGSESYSESMISDSVDLTSPSDLSISGLPSVPDIDDLDMAQFLNKKNHGQAKEKLMEPVVQLQSKPNGTIPESIFSNLKEENQVKVWFETIEMTEACVCPTVVWIEYQLPTLADPIRFRTKVSSPFKTPKEIRLDSKHKEFLNLRTLRQWEDQVITFQVTGLGLPKRTIGAKQIRNSAMQELWVAKGTLKCRDVLLSELNWSGEIALTMQDDVKFTPANIVGYIKLTIRKESEKEIFKMVKEPAYFCIQATTVHGLQFKHDPPHDGTLVHLSMRLFKSDTRMTTIPMLWHSEFDKDSGTMNLPNNLDFLHILPLAIDDEFMAQYGKLPIVVEVHAIPPKSSTSKSLLGLVRVPFNQLLGAFKAANEQQMVQIPDSDYPILDPFSGLTCGWLSVSMGIGSWKEMEAIKMNKNNADLMTKNAFDVEPVVEEQVVIEEEEEDRSPTPVPVADDITPKQSPRKAESVIQVTIHRACGLLGLLEKVIDKPSNQPLFEALDFAIQTGTNPFISLDLFPQDEEGIEEFSPDTIQTNVVAYSFTPQFEYSIELTIESLDTDLIMWIKNGGKAVGRIWHRIPRHLCLDKRDYVCLGVFSIPLMELLSQQNGIMNQWFMVGEVGAVQCSLQLKDGFDLASVIPQSTRIEQQVELELSINNVQLPMDASQKGLVIRWKNPGNEEQDAFVSNILQLKQEEHYSVLSEAYYEKQVLTFVDAYPRDVLEISFYSSSMDVYYGSCFIKTNKLLMAARALMRSRNSRMGDPVFESKVSLIDTESPDLHCHAAWIRLEMHMVPKSRTTSEAIPMRTEMKMEPSLSFLQEKSFDQSILLQQSQQKDEKEGPLTVVSLESSPKESKTPAEDVFQKLSQDLSHLNIDQRMEATKRIPEEEKSPEKVKVEHIPIYVSIEKALHLPLVDDPLAKSFQSPFVKHSNLETAPPSASVSLKIPTGFKEAGQFIETNIEKSQTSPHWNHEVCLSLQKNVSVIETIKTDGVFVFEVWNTHEVDDEFMSSSKPRTTKRFLGSCTVPLSPLFSGLDEIHGWYPVRDHGLSKGQLMVRIHPTQDLNRLLMELKQDGHGKIQSRSIGVIRKKEPTLYNRSWNKLQSRSTILSRSRDSVIQRPIVPKTTVKSQDTWVWDGHAWVHKQLDPVEPPVVELTRLESIGTKSISQTIDELDILKRDMLSRLQKLEIGGEPLKSDLVEPKQRTESEAVHRTNSPSISDPVKTFVPRRNSLGRRSSQELFKPLQEIVTNLPLELPKPIRKRSSQELLDGKRSSQELLLNESRESSPIRSLRVDTKEYTDHDSNPFCDSSFEHASSLFVQSPKRSEPDLSIKARILDSDSEDELDILAHRKSLTSMKPPLPPQKSEYSIPFKE